MAGSFSATVPILPAFNKLDVGVRVYGIADTATINYTGTVEDASGTPISFPSGSASGSWNGSYYDYDFVINITLDPGLSDRHVVVNIAAWTDPGLGETDVSLIAPTIVDPGTGVLTQSTDFDVSNPQLYSKDIRLFITVYNATEYRYKTNGADWVDVWYSTDGVDVGYSDYNALLTFTEGELGSLGLKTVNVQARNDVTIDGEYTQLDVIATAAAASNTYFDTFAVDGDNPITTTDVIDIELWSALLGATKYRIYEDGGDVPVWTDITGVTYDFGPPIGEVWFSAGFWAKIGTSIPPFNTVLDEWKELPIPFTLSFGGGTKNLIIEFSNDFMAASSESSESIILEITNITGAFIINNNDDLTNTKEVVLTIAVNNAISMRFKNELDGAWSAPEAYATTKNWNLLDEHGTRTVYGEFSNGTVSTVLKDRIALVKSIPPPQLEATGGNAFIDVTWGKTVVTNFLGYNLYRTLISGQDYVRINTDVLDTNSYVDEDVVNGVRYYYVATVVTTTGRESVASNEASAIPQTVSTELTETFITFKGNSSNVKVYWTNGNLYTKNGVFKIKGNIEELPKISGTQFENLDIETDALVLNQLQEEE